MSQLMNGTNCMQEWEEQFLVAHEDLERIIYCSMLCKSRPGIKH